MPVDGIVGGQQVFFLGQVHLPLLCVSHHLGQQEGVDHLGHDLLTLQVSAERKREK